MLEQVLTQNGSDLQQTIYALIHKLLTEEGVTPGPITLDSTIGDLGMSSMTFAELVSELEQRLEIDPFDDDLSITDIVSVGDLISAYRRCMAA